MPPDAPQSPTPAGELIPAAIRFVRVLRRRRSVVYNCLLVAGSLGVAYYTVATRLYESAARLLIIEQKQDQIAAVGEPNASDNTMATHRELVASPVVLQGAIDRLAPTDRVDLVDKPPHEWLRTLSRGLSASTTRRTNLINVSYRSRNPRAAAAVVRAVIESYLDFVRKNHQGSASELKHVFAEEGHKAAADLAAKQSDLQQFRQRVGHLALPSDKGVVDPVVERALQLNDALIEAQRRRLELESTLAAVNGAIARGDDATQYLAGIEQSVGQQMTLMSLGMSEQDMNVLGEQENKLLAAQDEYQELSAFYGPNHPRIAELQQQIGGLSTYLRDYRTNLGKRFDPANNAEMGVVVKTMLDQAVGQARQREEQLAGAFAAARDDAARYSGSLAELQMKERDVARADEYYNLLRDKIANVDSRQEQAPLQVTVVSEPTPARAAASPQLRLVALASLLAGLAVGAMIVYVEDVLDDRFDSPEELAAQVGAPLLALVRDLDPLDAPGFDGVHVHAKPNSPSAEAFRTLRTALTLNPAPSNRLLISSSEPGDGKTTVAVNLAVAFAQSGKRTLVIDADLRKPGLTTRLALRAQPGVADVLASDAPVAEIAERLVHRAAVPNLDILPTGMRCPNPAELLGGIKFAELLAWAESRYDQLLVDCPPVLAVSDAQIVGRLVDGGVIVVRPDKNHRRLVMRALDNFRATGCQILGVVANGVSAELSGYGYGYDYGYETDAPVDAENPEAQSPAAPQLALHSQVRAASDPSLGDDEDIDGPRLPAIELPVESPAEWPADYAVDQPAIRPRRAA